MLKKIKHVFQYGHIWWQYYLAHQKSLRPAVIHNMINMLSCGTSSRGHARYDCPNPECTHTKRVLFTCKSRSCPSCGKKATYQWSAKQQAILPATKWQHIVMTMPKELWRLFALNRQLLSDLSPLAASCIQTLANNQHVTPGIFTALHTFGRDLKWNVHVHLSTTCGGLTTDGNWQQLYYKKQTLMRMWRYRVIDLLREAHKNGKLKLPHSLRQYCPTQTAFNAWLGRRYEKCWILHCAKPTNNHTHTVNYLGRYIKRPPLSQSRLKHYNGSEVHFNFHDHKSKKQKTFHASATEFIRRFVQHIPDKHFRIVRYYGFLANRNRKTLLPKVYDALNQSERKQFFFSFAYLYKQTFGKSPLDCILCNTKMKLAAIKPGLSLKKLMPHHQKIALAKPIII